MTKDPPIFKFLSQIFIVKSFICDKFIWSESRSPENFGPISAKTTSTVYILKYSGIEINIFCVLRSPFIIFAPDIGYISSLIKLYFILYFFFFINTYL